MRDEWAGRRIFIPYTESGTRSPHSPLLFSLPTLPSIFPITAIPSQIFVCPLPVNFINVCLYMLGGVASVAIFTSHTAPSNNGFQVASFLVDRSSNLSRKYSIPQPFFKISGFREHIFQFVASNNGSLARKNIVFAIPNDRDAAEKEGSDYCADYAVIIDQKEDGTSCAPEMETIFSLLPCGEGTFRINEINGKEDGLLAKLMAFHLRVLAMEQWNASKLKMSHKTSCIMLNKGKCIVEAVSFLHNIEQSLHKAKCRI